MRSIVAASLRASHDANETNISIVQMPFGKTTKHCGGCMLRSVTSFAHIRLRLRHMSNSPLGAKHVGRPGVDSLGTPRSQSDCGVITDLAAPAEHQGHRYYHHRDIKVHSLEKSSPLTVCVVKLQSSPCFCHTLPSRQQLLSSCR